MEKLVKSQLLLCIYDRVLRGEEISTEDVIAELKISKRTFYRYIAEIRNFFENFYIDNELVFDKEKNAYKLVKKGKKAER